MRSHNDDDDDDDEEAVGPTTGVRMLTEAVPLSQAIPYHGISSNSTPKGSKRVSGLITR